MVDTPSTPSTDSIAGVQGDYVDSITLLPFVQTNASTFPVPEIEKYVDDATTFYFKLAVVVIVCSLISVVGMVTNVFNGIVFFRQGILTESNVVSLFCLAISDFWCVTSMLWVSIGVGIAMADPPDLNWSPFDVMYLTGSWPHLMFAQFTRMVTAFVAFERCMCVVFPFKVRSWFVPKRSLTFIIGMFVYCVVSYSPLFITQQLQFVTDSSTNETKLSLVFSQDREMTVAVLFYINSVVNIGSVAVVSVCTMITVSRVSLSKTWRETRAKSTTVATDATPSSKKEGKQQTISNMGKERKLIRMVTMISSVFLLCYVPDFIFFLIFLVNPDIRTFGPYNNLAQVIYSIILSMETINSSSNIVVYYNMSSRYKQEMDALFKKKTSKIC